MWRKSLDNYFKSIFSDADRNIGWKVCKSKEYFVGVRDMPYTRGMDSKEKREKTRKIYEE